MSVLPAISIAVIAYFGYHAIWGERGMLALSDIRARLDVQKAALVQAQAARARLQHRIALVRSGDPDVIEEYARSQLMIGGPGQVAVPRTAH